MRAAVAGISGGCGRRNADGPALSFPNRRRSRTPRMTIRRRTLCRRSARSSWTPTRGSPRSSSGRRRRLSTRATSPRSIGSRSACVADVPHRRLTLRSERRSRGARAIRPGCCRSLTMTTWTGTLTRSAGSSPTGSRSKANHLRARQRPRADTNQCKLRTRSTTEAPPTGHTYGGLIWSPSATRYGQLWRVPRTGPRVRVRTRSSPSAAG